MRPDIPSSPNPIAQVTPGMHVVDADGEEVGTDIAAAPADRNAVTAQDPPSGAGVLSGKAPHPDDGDEPEVPADLAARLLRTGYLKVDGQGLLARDLYVEADQVAGVTQDVVQLTVPRDQLAPRET
jgi:hypothetical protein